MSDCYFCYHDVARPCVGLNATVFNRFGSSFLYVSDNALARLAVGDISYVPLNDCLKEPPVDRWRPTVQGVASSGWVPADHRLWPAGLRTPSGRQTDVEGDASTGHVSGSLSI